MVKDNRSKEVKAIVRAVTNYIEKHNGNVIVLGDILAFDKKGEIVDDIILGYGDKKIMQIAAKDLLKEIKKDKEDFINW